jgi:hypothetical protein
MASKSIALTACVLGIVMAWPFLARSEEPQGKTSKIMEQKLKQSQKLLEGIALAEYEKITRSAEELIQLTKSEEWQKLKTPRYETYTGEFRDAAENIIAKAKMKNLDGVTLAYFEMTMSCVRCHRYMRETRDTRLETPKPQHVAIAP